MTKKWRSALVALFVAGIIAAAPGASVYATYDCGTYGAGGYGTEEGCTPATTPKTTSGSSSSAQATTEDGAGVTEPDTNTPVMQKDDQPKVEAYLDEKSDDTSGEVSLGYVQLSLSAFAILFGIGLLILVLKRRRGNGTPNGL